MVDWEKWYSLEEKDGIIPAITVDSVDSVVTEYLLFSSDSKHVSWFNKHLEGENQGFRCRYLKKKKPLYANTVPN